MNRLVDRWQERKDAAMMSSESDGLNDSDVTSPSQPHAYGATNRQRMAASTTTARVCTCSVTDDNRIDSAACPRHDMSGGLLVGVAWDAISGGNHNLTERR